jgi:hypothetical protein
MASVNRCYDHYVALIITTVLYTQQANPRDLVAEKRNISIDYTQSKCLHAEQIPTRCSIPRQRVMLQTSLS